MVPANIRIAELKDYVQMRDHVRKDGPFADTLNPPPFITPVQAVRPDERPFVRKFDMLPK